MNPEEAYRKCLNEEKRILELEKIIVTNSYYSYLYAYNIIQGPWKLGEKSLLKNCLWSFEYARNVIKGPFQKCHPIIFNSEMKNNYIDFLKSINYDLNKISEWLI